MTKEEKPAPKPTSKPKADAKPVEPKEDDRKFFIIVAHRLTADLSEYREEDDFMKALSDKLASYSGHGAKVFCFHGTRIEFTNPMVKVGLVGVPSGAKGVTLRQATENTAGRTPSLPLNTAEGTSPDIA